MRRIRSDRHPRGFTLVEMIISITLVGVLAVVAVPMLRLPMTAYMDAAHRADLASELDASVGRLHDDLGQALPNSIRTTQVGARWFIEYLEVRAWGRYRAFVAIPPGLQSCPPSLDTDMLDLGLNETCFISFGPLQGGAPVVGSDWVVINPLASAGAVGNPYFGGVTTPVGGIKSRLQSVTPALLPGSRRITMSPHQMPAGASTHQFYIVSTPVSYECNPATGRLTRYAGYAITAAQPTAFAAGVGAPLATLIGNCSFRYQATGAPGRGGIVSVWLRFTLPTAGTGVPESVESFSEFSVREPT